MDGAAATLRIAPEAATKVRANRPDLPLTGGSGQYRALSLALLIIP